MLACLPGRAGPHTLRCSAAPATAVLKLCVCLACDARWNEEWRHPGARYEKTHHGQKKKQCIPGPELRAPAKPVAGTRSSPRDGAPSPPPPPPSRSPPARSRAPPPGGQVGSVQPDFWSVLGSLLVERTVLRQPALCSICALYVLYMCAICTAASAVGAKFQGPIVFVFGFYSRPVFVLFLSALTLPRRHQ
jgi:hypothetical protein